MAFRWDFTIAASAVMLGACASPPTVASRPMDPAPPPAASSASVAKPVCPPGGVALKILGFNDLHGQLSAGRKKDGRPVGGASVLAAYLRKAHEGFDDRWLLIHAGDLVGASPPASGLLQDEPTVDFVGMLANSSCTGPIAGESACNVVATLGNHEFDEGKDELWRLIHGGDHPRGPFLDNPYRGARFPYVCSNVVDATTGKGFVDPYTIVRIGGVRVGVIGAVLRETPTMVRPSGVAGLSFLPEADAINSAVRSLQAAHVHAIVVALHQGLNQPGYEGPTRADAVVQGQSADIVHALDDDVDVVVSGHYHQFTNAFVPTASGKRILVTQAYSAGTAFADIDVSVDCTSDDVTHASARIVTTYADVAPGTTPDAKVAELVAAAEERTRPMTSRIVATLAHPLDGRPNAAGESVLGDLIADAQRASLHADVAFTNSGGIRADLDAGQVTWGQLFTAQPFGNDLVSMGFTGRALLDLLESQWDQNGGARVLQVSGIEYTWDAARPVGQRVLSVRIGGKPLVPTAKYTLCVSTFLADGGDGFVQFRSGSDRRVAGGDLDALVTYLGALKQPVDPAAPARIKRLH